MTSLHTKEFVTSLALIHQVISVTHMARITVWGVFTFGSRTPDHKKRDTITPGSASLATKVQLPQKGTSFILSSRMTTPTHRQTGFAQRVQKG